MAIVQISQITNRLGLNIDLPQLAGAELGWSTDTRQLYIGNGTLEQGAPVIGNTEILTEFSDILNLAAAYTYKGTAAGYTVQTGPTSGTPVTQSLQNWLDQFATVKDFGAKGDGLTDDTAAINRALNQLYCQQQNVQIRRSLFFPAGKYVVSSTINIPPYATLYGEGPENSIIQLADGGTETCVAQTADSLQQTGVNMGSNSATLPTDINIINMAFQSLNDTTDIFLIDSATNCEFHGVSFIGPGTTSTLITDALFTSGVAFDSTSATTSNILFNGCRFNGTVYGSEITTVTKGVTFTNSSFNTLYQGLLLATNPTGTRITNNVFDNIFDSGVVINSASLNATGYNIFYDVANGFEGTANPAAPVIVISGNNNVSIGDMFERSDEYAVNYARVDIGTTLSISTTNGSQLQLGSKIIESGVTTTLSANVSATNPSTICTIDPTISPTFKIDYQTMRNSNTVTKYRTGTFWVSSSPTYGINSMDDYTENSDAGITLTATQTTPTVLSNVIIVNTSGGFTSDPANVSVGQIITLSGVFANANGNIGGNAYTSYGNFYVISANANANSFVLSTSSNGSNIITNPGNTANVTFTQQVYTSDIKIQYSSTAGQPAQMSYSISYFN